MSTDTNVEIIINLLPGTLSKLEAKQVTSHINGVENELKLTTSNKTTNTHLFDAKQRLRKYATTEDIICEYIPVRLEYYTKRKEYQCNELKKQVILLSNKARFIQEQCKTNSTYDVKRRTKS